MRKRNACVMFVGLLMVCAVLPGFAAGADETPTTTATAVPIGEYNEPPMLAALVQQGKLPPVDQRLPENPLVVEPFESIGKYGGTLNIALRGVPSHGLPGKMNIGSTTLLDTDDLKTITPGIIAAWEFSEDFKTITLMFRKKMKWSDGEPFTVDDVLFWYEDRLFNTEWTPTVPAFWRGTSATRVNDYTIQFTFPTPRPHFLRPFGIRNEEVQSGFYYPRHYVEQFHPKYNADAQKNAKAEGYDHWYQQLHVKGRWTTRQINPEVPVVAPWMLVEATKDFLRWERNPYFWAVDTAGNQLPYIDGMMGTYALDAELRQAKVLAGDYDVVEPGDIVLANYPELKRNEKNTGMRAWTVQTDGGARMFFAPNQTNSDPKKRELYSMYKFREALSHAVNRDQINEIVYLGLGVPQQTVMRIPAIYDEELANLAIEYNPDRANRLLDEVGLDKRNRDGFRTWQDGSDLRIYFQWDQNNAIYQKSSELIVRDLREVGLDVTGRPTGQPYEVLDAGDVDIGTWSEAYGTVLDFLARGASGNWLGWWYGNAWFQWIRSEGVDGEEPPDWLKDIAQKNDRISQIPEEEAIEALRESMSYVVENLYLIGTIGGEPIAHAVRENLRNVREDIHWGESGYGATLVVQPFQWYYE